MWLWNPLKGSSGWTQLNSSSPNGRFQAVGFVNLVQNSTNLFILGGQLPGGQPLNVPYTTRVNLTSPFATNWTALTPNLPGDQRIYQSVLTTAAVTGSNPNFNLTTYFVYAGGIFITDPQSLPLNDVWSAVAQVAPAAPFYTFCVKYRGVLSSSLDDQYSIALLVSGTYNTTLLTSTVGRYTPSGQYYNLLTASGARTTRTRYDVLVVNTISNLLPIGSVQNNSRFYISNISLPQFVDTNGTALNFSTPALFPGKVFTSYSNLYRSGAYGSLTEFFTAGEDITSPTVSAFIAGWNGTEYVPGSCVPDPVLSQIPPAKPAAATYQFTISYNLSGISTSTSSWSVATRVIFQSDVIDGPDQLGDYYFQLNSTARLLENGTRQYCFYNKSGTFCETSRIYQVYQNASLFADNRIYVYFPNVDSNGIAYLVDPAQPRPGSSFEATSNFTTVFNPYISPVTGLGLLEGFFPDRFARDGPPTDSIGVNTSLTVFLGASIVKLR